MLDLRKRVPPYIQTMHERGKKLAKGICSTPDCLQVVTAKKSGKLVDRAQVERQREQEKAAAEGKSKTMVSAERYDATDFTPCPVQKICCVAACIT
jgi:hypothetical protein